jgi:hypothetical protein
MSDRKLIVENQKAFSLSDVTAEKSFPSPFSNGWFASIKEFFMHILLWKKKLERYFSQTDII